MDYFYQKFGVTRDLIDKTLARAMARGGQWGELFFEHSRRGSVILLDGKVSEAYASVELGAGVRCVVEDQIGYAYTESFLPEDMFAAADAAAAIAPGVNATTISERKCLELKRYYGQDIDWDALDVSRAVTLLQNIDRKTRAKDAEIVQVTVGLNWNQRTISIHTTDGIHAQDNQPYFTIRLNIVMKRGNETQSNGANTAALDAFDASPTTKSTPSSTKPLTIPKSCSNP